jgi:hypothetical protein
VEVHGTVLCLDERGSMPRPPAFHDPLARTPLIRVAVLLPLFALLEGSPRRREGMPRRSSVTVEVGAVTASVSRLQVEWLCAFAAALQPYEVAFQGESGWPGSGVIAECRAGGLGERGF